jgi:hypothetical protein
MLYSRIEKNSHALRFGKQVRGRALWLFLSPDGIELLSIEFSTYGVPFADLFGEGVLTTTQQDRSLRLVDAEQSSSKR